MRKEQDIMMKEHAQLKKSNRNTETKDKNLKIQWIG